MTICNHICTSECRQTGCNCACGEYHQPRSMTLYTITRENAELPPTPTVDEAGLRRFFASLARPVAYVPGEAFSPTPKGWWHYARTEPVDYLIKTLRDFEYIVDVNYQLP